MQTPSWHGDSENPPLSCTVCLAQEGVIGTGRIWAFYHDACHIQSALRVSPGMIVSLSFQLSTGARVKLETGLMTWARRSGFAFRFVHEPATRYEKTECVMNKLGLWLLLGLLLVGVFLFASCVRLPHQPAPQ